MWAALIVIAQVLGAALPGGQEDFDLCRGETTGTREESIAACQRVTGKQVLDKVRIAAAYYLLARAADSPADAITNWDQVIALANIGGRFKANHINAHIIDAEFACVHAAEVADPCEEILDAVLRVSEPGDAKMLPASAAGRIHRTVSWLFPRLRAASE